MKQQSKHHPYRNGFEKRVADQLGDGWEYESMKLSYVVPARKASYTPDFINHDTKTIVESKGFFRAEDRKKMLLIKEQNPDWTIKLLFQNPQATISKASKTTYAIWAEKNGFVWEQLPKGK